MWLDDVSCRDQREKKKKNLLLSLEFGTVRRGGGAWVRAWGPTNNDRSKAETVSGFSFVYFSHLVPRNSPGFLGTKTLKHV